MLHPLGEIWAERVLPAGYEAGRRTRGAASPGRRAGEIGCLRDRRDAVLGERADALGGGDAHLGDVLDAAGDAGELLGHDVGATRGVLLHGVAVAADDALEAGAGLLDVALELVARRGAATLVAGLELLELALGLLARAERVGQRAGGADDAVARLSVAPTYVSAARSTIDLPCSAVVRAARTLALAASRVCCEPACGRGGRSSSTASWPSCCASSRPAASACERPASWRRPLLRGGLRRGGGVVVVVLVSFSAMVAFPPALRIGFESGSPLMFPANTCT